MASEEDERSGDFKIPGKDRRREAENKGREWDQGRALRAFHMEEHSAPTNKGLQAGCAWASTPALRAGRAQTVDRKHRHRKQARLPQ